MRQQIVALYGQQMPTRQIAQVMGTCPSGTRRIRQLFRERGTLEPIKPKTGYASGLTPQVIAQIQTLVAEDPGLTRQTLRDRLGVSVDVRTVGRWLRRLGLVLKKSRSKPPSSSDLMSKRDANNGTNR